MLENKRLMLGMGMTVVVVLLILSTSYYFARPRVGNFPPAARSNLPLLGDTPVPGALAPLTSSNDAPTAPDGASSGAGTLTLSTNVGVPAATDVPTPVPQSDRGPDGRYISADLDPARPIPDNDPAGVVSHIIVTETFAVKAVRLLNLRVTHADTGELRVTLRAPDGTSITPLSGTCPGIHNWHALSLDDGAPRAVGAGCQNDLDDAFRPPAGQELARFAGHPAHGDWTLQMVDTRPGNAGTLDAWSLLFTDTLPVRPSPTPLPNATSPTPAPPQVERGPDGRYLSTDLDPARPIPDNNPAGVISRITVPETFAVKSVRLLNLRVTHPNVGELRVTLRAPDGTSITPLSDACPGIHNWRALTLDDGAPRAVGAGCQNDLDDAFQPPAGQELARFAGRPAHGDWTLQVIDTRPGNAGTLGAWSLLFTNTLPVRLTPTPAAAPPAAGTPTPAPSDRGPDGRYIAGDLDTPRAIPDNNPAGVISQIIIPESFPIVAVQLLNLHVQHPDTGELRVTLRAPDGTSITPLNGVCPGTHNWHALSLDDGIGRTVGATCQNDLDDAFHPPAGQELARFAGHPAHGQWTLQVIDTRPGNAGTLHGWSLLFTTTVPSRISPTPAGPPTPAGTPTPAPSDRGPDGRYIASDLDTPRAIPDNNPAGTVSQIIIPESFAVKTVQLLNLHVEHADTSELQVTLRAPDGTSITPLSGACPGMHNWHALTLDDSAPRTVGVGCQNDLDDAFRPPAGQELARFAGHPAQGQWTLQVVDTRPGTAGTLHGWSLLFTDTPPVHATPTSAVPPPPVGTPTPAPSDRSPDGRYIASDLDTPRPIPDNDPAGTVSHIIIPQSFPVGGVQLLNLQVQHADPSELRVTLHAPDGTTITPIVGLCPGARNWRALTLDDGAPRPLGEGCQDDLDDAFRPPTGQELARFVGHPAQGQWTLQIVDTRPGNTGTLRGWSLLFTSAAATPTIPALKK